MRQIPRLYRATNIQRRDVLRVKVWRVHVGRKTRRGTGLSLKVEGRINI